MPPWGSFIPQPDRAAFLLRAGVSPRTHLRPRSVLACRQGILRNMGARGPRKTSGNVPQECALKTGTTGPDL